MSNPHQGQRLIVTGGASGIGLAVARLALQRGARVCILDHNVSILSDLQTQFPGQVHFLACNVADSDSVLSAVDQAIDLIDGLDAVVNSAGIDALSPLDKLSDAEWARTLAVNLTGPMLVCRAALPHLRKAGGGTIVNVASGAGLSPLMHRTAYCASKAGVIMFGKALAMEVAADGIRVNSVCPGAVDTPLFRTSYENSEDPQRELEAIRQRYAMQRIALPQEIAEAILFMSSPASSYITGTALAVDGGRTFH
jgi:NAD(P)-dependent dehydrogenase (short-subunit alcohol dehydrogenase family)